MLKEKKIIEVQTMEGNQHELIVAKTNNSDLVGRVNENDEIVYDIAIVNPAAMDLVDIINHTEGARIVLQGNPLMQAEGELVVEWKDNKIVPIGKVQFVPNPVIGAGVVRFEREDREDQMTRYVLTNFKPLGVINLIDARIK